MQRMSSRLFTGAKVTGAKESPSPRLPRQNDLWASQCFSPSYSCRVAFWRTGRTAGAQYMDTLPRAFFEFVFRVAASQASAINLTRWDARHWPVQISLVVWHPLEKPRGFRVVA